jgi:hypothetical protein
LAQGHGVDGQLCALDAQIVKDWLEEHSSKTFGAGLETEGCVKLAVTSPSMDGIMLQQYLAYGFGYNSDLMMVHIIWTGFDKHDFMGAFIETQALSRGKSCRERIPPQFRDPFADKRMENIEVVAVAVG